MSHKQHIIENVCFQDNQLALTIDGSPYTFSLAELSRKLLHATDEERLHFHVAPSGYGIHWETVDEDLSIDGLLGIHHLPVQGKQLAAVHESTGSYQTK